jgi:hypothetical protein
LARKTEATFHLTAPAVSVFVVLLTLLIFPSFFLPLNVVEPGTLRAGLFGLTILAIATGSAGTFYIASQRRQGRSLARTLWHLPMVLAVGIGISVNNARAVIEALVGHRSPFIRTPKVGDEHRADSKRTVRRWRLTQGLVETTLGLAMSACVVLALVTGRGLISIPFLALFAIGYLTVGIGSMRDQWLGLT